jgi:hypothetical protein
MAARKKTRRTATKKAAKTRRTATKKAASPRARRSRGSAAGTRLNLDPASVEILDRMRMIVYAQLGAYGELYDELNARLSDAREKTPARWQKLVARGEQVERDLDKARVDLQKNLQRAQSQLRSNLERVQDQLRKRVAKLRPG